jgi:hypothetical protein
MSERKKLQDNIGDPVDMTFKPKEACRYLGAIKAYKTKKTCSAIRLQQVFFIFGN